MAWSRLYRPPYAFCAAWASCWLCFLCCEKHHSCSLFRGIHSYAFLMQPAIFPRSSEARVDNPAPLSAPYDSLHMLGLGLARERGSLCSSSLSAAPHALASMRPTLQRRRTWLIYLRNNQTKRRGDGMKKKNDVSNPSYEIIATHSLVVPLNKRKGTIYTYTNGITVLGPLSVGCMWFREPQQYVRHVFSRSYPRWLTGGHFVT